MQNRGLLGGFGETMMEAGKSVVKQSTQVAKQQISGSSHAPSQGTPGPEQLAASAQGNTPQDQALDATQDANQDFVKDMYGSSQQQNAGSIQQTAQMQAVSDQQQLDEARKRLEEFHLTNYYRPRFENRKQEESVAERLEREDQEKQAKKMEEMKEEQKKNEVPMAVRMGAQRAEKFPGASG